MVPISMSDIPDEITCPVCMDMFTSQISQCKNGHVICKPCVHTLSLCPQCRVPYGKSPIRNLALENVLDKMSFRCTYSENGCQAELKPKEMQDHNLNCFYRAPTVNSCRILGFSCNSKFSSIDVIEALCHIKSKHFVQTIRSTEELKITLTNSNINQKLVNGPIRKYWEPYLIEDENCSRRLLIRAASWVDLNSLSMMVDVLIIKMCEVSNETDIPVEVSFNLTLKPGTRYDVSQSYHTTKSTTKSKTVDWTAEAISFSQCQDPMPVKSVCFHSNTDLLRYLPTNDLVLKCKFPQNRYFLPQSPSMDLELAPIPTEHLKPENLQVSISYRQRHYFINLNGEDMLSIVMLLFGFFWVLIQITVNIHNSCAVGQTTRQQ